MTSHKDWAEKTVESLKKVQEAVTNLNTAKKSTEGTEPDKISGKAVADALAEYCKSDNSTTQALALRLKNIADKYPQRAA